MERKIKGIIFDLDGVIVSTDTYHYKAWKSLATQLSIAFDRHDNERLRGVSRMESLKIILEKSTVEYSTKELESMLETKNTLYQSKLSKLSQEDILPGIKEVLNFLKEANIPIAIGSSSKNAPIILKQIGVDHMFEAMIDGNQISKSKPDPEVFLKAAVALGLEPQECLVVEDADAGIKAALAGNMPVVAVGAAHKNSEATYCRESLSVDFIRSIIE